MNTTIQQKKQKIDFNTSRCCDLMQWSVDKYYDHLYNTAIAYLEEYYSGDPEAIKLMSEDTAFWGWFISMWDARDEAFLHEMDGREDQFTPDRLASFYKAIHVAEDLACEIAPPRCVYPKGFGTISIKTKMPTV